ncbi:hypothetical protein CDAR_551681 [Caerostris darwini]|uniref:Uncharacterized protein n=1 Tax=Caerostris darwini TaxID=1538125 RepID=A0AAV4V6J7_9ARAC|nr:hypothetical protein CDAR_551681 [Caerostris darwini]
MSHISWGYCNFEPSKELKGNETEGGRTGRLHENSISHSTSHAEDVNPPRRPPDYPIGDQGSTVPLWCGCEYPW